MKEVMTVFVEITNQVNVISEKQNVYLLYFSGKAYGDFFTGDILPGGLDRQMETKDRGVMMSARYCMRGKDDTDTECFVYVENTVFDSEKWEDGSLKTSPQVWTDSKSLKWLEQEELVGKLTVKEEGVFISIYTKQS